MKIVAVLLVCLALSAFADVKTGGVTQSANPVQGRGSYTVVNTLIGGLSYSYGLALKTNVPNSIWILNWNEMYNYEFDLQSGNPLGSWPITGGVDPDDQAYCEYPTGNQWFMTDYTASFFSVFAEDGTYLRNINGPAGYTNIFGIGAGNGYMYIGSPNQAKLAWGPYTGTETSITWSEMDYTSVYGLAVWENYLFIACGLEFEDNIFIHEITADGSPSAAPIWSTTFWEEDAVNGGIDFDGEYLYIYPQNTFLYQLSLDWDPQSLAPSTWGNIKATF